MITYTAAERAEAEKNNKKFFDVWKKAVDSWEAHASSVQWYKDNWGISETEDFLNNMKSIMLAGRRCSTKQWNVMLRMSGVPVRGRPAKTPPTTTPGTAPGTTTGATRVPTMSSPSSPALPDNLLRIKGKTYQMSDYSVLLGFIYDYPASSVNPQISTPEIPLGAWIKHFVTYIKMHHPELQEDATELEKVLALYLKMKEEE